MFTTTSFQEGPHQKLFFHLQESEDEGWLGWMKKYRECPRSLFNGKLRVTDFYLKQMLKVSSPNVFSWEVHLVEVKLLLYINCLLHYQPLLLTIIILTLL